MNDLISRSELIENFRKCYSGHLGMENSDACMTFHGICNVINNTNTVYDVDKVVEELKETMQDLSVIEVFSHIDFDSTIQSGLDNFLKAYNSELLRIVRQGGKKIKVAE